MFNTPESSEFSSSVKYNPPGKGVLYNSMERRKNRGAIIVSRCLADHPQFGVDKPHHLAALILILTQTAYKPWTRDIGGNTYHLETGDVIMPQEYLAKRLGVGRKKVRAILKDMIDEGFLAIKENAPNPEGPQIDGQKGHKSKAKRGRKYTLLSVRNFREYQDWSSYKGHRTRDELATPGPQKRGKKGQYITNGKIYNKNPLPPNGGRTASKKPKGKPPTDHLDHDPRQVDLEDLISGCPDTERREVLIAEGRKRVAEPAPKPKIGQKSPKSDGIAEADVDWAVEEFRKVADEFGLPQPRRDRKIPQRTRDAIRNRLIMDGGREAWAEALEEIRRTKFLTGRGKKPFKADLHFVTQPKSFDRLVQGYYSALEGRDPNADDRARQKAEIEQRNTEEYNRAVEADLERRRQENL